MHKALIEAAARIKAGEPAGLAIHIVAQKHGINRHQLASQLGKRGARAKAHKVSPKQLSLELY